MFWSKLCKSTWNCAWNLAFPVFISPIVWNMCENLPYESVYFKELHNEQECYWPTIYRAGAAVVSTITSIDQISIECFTHVASIYANLLVQKIAFAYKEKSSTPTGLVWDTNMAAITSCEKTLLTRTLIGWQSVFIKVKNTELKLSRHLPKACFEN